MPIALSRSPSASAARVTDFARLPEQLRAADIVVASTASPRPIIGRNELAQVMAERPDKPLLLIDIAVPRDVEAACGELEGVALYDIDDMQAVVARNLNSREGEIPRAMQIIEEEIARFAVWLGQLDALPTIAALRRHGDEIAEQVIAENEGRWQSLEPRPTASASNCSRARSSGACCTSPTSTCASSRRARARHARDSCASFWPGGARHAGARGAGAGRGARPRRPPLQPARRSMRLGTRGSAWPSAGRVVARAIGDCEIVVLTHQRRRRRAGRQVALGRQDRGGARDRRDRPRGALREGRPGHARAGPHATRRAAAGHSRGRALRGPVARGPRAGSAGRHLQPAPRGAAARRAWRP